MMHGKRAVVITAERTTASQNISWGAFVIKCRLSYTPSQDDLWRVYR